MIRFICKCGKKIRVDDKYAGRSGKCPRCGAEIKVPAPKESPTAPEGIELTPLSPEEKFKIDGPSQLQPSHQEKQPESEPPKKEEGEPETFSLAADSLDAADRDSSELGPAASLQEPSSGYEISQQDKEEAPQISAASVGVCLSCGKSVSIQAYREFGYYCSAECKQAVRAKTGVTEMRAQTDRAEAVANVVRTVILGLVGLVAIAAVALVAFLLIPRLTRPQGEFAWKFQSDSDFHICELAATDNRMYFLLSNGTLQRLETENLGKLWAVPLQGEPIHRLAPVPTQNGVLAATTAGVFSLSEDGNPIWSRTLTAPGTMLTKFWAEEKIFALIGDKSLLPDEYRQTYAELQKPGGYPGMSEDNLPTWPQRQSRPNGTVLVAIDPATGNELWRKDFRNAMVTDLITWKDRVWLTTSELSDSPAMVMALERDTGNDVFRKPVPGGYGCHLASSDAGIALADAHRIMVLKENGEPLFEKQLPGGGPASRVAVADNLLVAKLKDGSIRCYELTSGAEKWSDQIGAGSFPPVISSGKVFVSGVPAGKRPPDIKEATRLVQMEKEAIEHFSIGRLVPRTLPDLAAYDLKTGSKLWYAEDAGERFSVTPKYVYSLYTEKREEEIVRRPIYRSCLEAFSIKSGKKVWDKAVAEMGVSRKPPITSGNAFFINLFIIEQWVTESGVNAKARDNRLFKVTAE